MMENPAGERFKPVAPTKDSRLSSLTFDFTARAIGVKNKRCSQGCRKGRLIGRALVDAANVETSEVDVAMTCRYEGR